MKPKLTDRSIRYAIRQLKKGRSTLVVAGELGVVQRHVQQQWLSTAGPGGRTHGAPLEGPPWRRTSTADGQGGGATWFSDTTSCTPI